MVCGSRNDTLSQQSSRSQAVVELLAAYSHTTQAADLQICVPRTTRDQRPAAESATTAPWSLCERLSDEVIRAMARAYRAGATARELAVAHDLSLSRVKRLLRTANARKRGLTR
jgi:hypothetical protein